MREFKLSEELLKSSGYALPGKGIHAGSRMYQKAITREDGGIDFYVNVDVYDELVKIGHSGLAPWVFLKCPGRGIEFRCEMIVMTDTTIKAVEEFFKVMFAAFGCEPVE